MRTVLALALSALLLAPRAANADDNGPERAEAHRLASEGDDAFAGGRCDHAVALWNQAESHFHAPTILYRIATCQKLLGKVVEASRVLEQIVAEKFAEGAPPAFAEVQREAQGELPSVRARIAMLEIVVDAQGVAAPKVATVDGDRVPATGVAVPVDPGDHFVRVTAGDATWEEHVQMEDGGRRTLRVALTAEVRPAQVPTQRIVGYVLGGVGMAAMAVGGGFGVAAVRDDHDLLGPCGQARTRCPSTPAVQDELSRLKTESLVADLLIGGGAAAFLAGAVVVLTSSPAKREEPRLHFAPMGMGAQLVGVF